MTVYLIEMHFHFQSFYCKILQMFLHSSTLLFSHLCLKALLPTWQQMWIEADHVLWIPNLWLMPAISMIPLTQPETVCCVTALCGFSVLISNLFSVSLRTLVCFMYSFNVLTIYIFGFMSYFCRTMIWSRLLNQMICAYDTIVCIYFDICQFD